MPNKIFNIRLRNKRDTEANWEKKDPLILDGETMVVTTASGETRVKIGDGAKNYTQLPFLDEVLKNEINNKAAIDAGVYTAVASSSDGVAYITTKPPRVFLSKIQRLQSLQPQLLAQSKSVTACLSPLMVLYPSRLQHITLARLTRLTPLGQMGIYT